ncbi:inositol monophosphatase family protein [Pelagicoccus sp. SDUM812003]|uniref:inositol monophosphatase family protein n=1 Tax=Pelagicoccus sp. SDUM812003 TaxID=3041267 RepID=UPI00280DC1EE|nr:inositol monophosphatase family protein [Pelagicoccus sp. SDUM812003]MDQ8202457.1 inositol monophosphatase family protein [Pelagicoccus sp. SDUM812003]
MGRKQNLSPRPNQSHFHHSVTTSSQFETFRTLLCQLGAAIRDTLRAQQHRPVEQLASVAERSTADVIYEIDKVSEELILRWLEENWPENLPVQLVMEGIEDDQLVSFPTATPLGKTAYKLIIDPIDGTRGLMYDKRSAWALIGLAPQRGPTTTLEDISVAAMTELPTSKQFISEQLSATRSTNGVTSFHRVSTDLIRKTETRLPASPSQANELSHGFLSVAKFFPQCKAALAAFEEELCHELTPAAERAEALIFDDQYISTGGQLYELIAGHDRLVIDIRPLAYAKHGYAQSLTCHPYDLCAALVARAAGVVVETAEAPELAIPLDTTTTVSWIAYANVQLADRVRPVLTELIQKHFD